MALDENYKQGCEMPWLDISQQGCYSILVDLGKTAIGSALNFGVDYCEFSLTSLLTSN